MDDKSAGIVEYVSLLLNVLLSWGSVGVQRGSVGVQRDAGGSVPLGVVATATPSSASNAKLKKVNANKWGQRINEVRVELNFKCCLVYCRCADSTQKERGLNV